MVTVFHYTPVNAKQFDGLNIDGLAGKRQNFALYGIHGLHHLSFILVIKSSQSFNINLYFKNARLSAKIECTCIYQNLDQVTSSW